VLERSRPDALPSERSTVIALPLYTRLLAQLQEKVKLLDEEIVVVVEVIAEERIGLDKRAATDDDLGSALRDKIECGEVLEDANWIVGAEHGHCRGEAYVPRARCGRSEKNCGRGSDVLFAVVFADAVNVDADTIGELNLLEEFADALRAKLSGRAF
jgi:hypothetical protein